MSQCYISNVTFEHLLVTMEPLEGKKLASQLKITLAAEMTFDIIIRQLLKQMFKLIVQKQTHGLISRDRALRYFNTFNGKREIVSKNQMFSFVKGSRNGMLCPF